jgi:CheY-like chemotaxis protein
MHVLPPSTAHVIEDLQIPPDARTTILLKQRVLVVDDSEGNRRLARRMLQQLGCAVVEAGDGDEVPAALAAAAAAASGASVDVVLMDIEMARVGGVAAVAALRRAGADMPVLAVTGNASAEDVATCAHARGWG